MMDIDDVSYFPNNIEEQDMLKKGLILTHASDLKTLKEWDEYPDEFTKINLVRSERRKITKYLSVGDGYVNHNGTNPLKANIVKKKACFIATKIYGDINHPNVESLREIRDKNLSQNKLGRLVIDLYYSGIGEKTAFMIGKIPKTIPTIRKSLDYVVQKYCNK